MKVTKNHLTWILKSIDALREELVEISNEKDNWLYENTFNHVGTNLREASQQLGRLINEEFGMNNVIVTVSCDMEAMTVLRVSHTSKTLEAFRNTWNDLTESITPEGAENMQEALIRHMTATHGYTIDVPEWEEVTIPVGVA